MNIRRRRRKKAAASPGKSMFNARRPVALGFLTLFLLWGGLFGWGVFASISGAVIAGGKVGVETRDQVVEHIDGGTVREILVREGDAVKTGDVLLRFDDKLLRSEEAILQAEAAELAARRNRLEAESRNADLIAWDPELPRLGETDSRVRAILDGQWRLFEARRASRAGQEAQLRERIGQTRKQIAGLEAQADSVKRQSGFLTRELDGHRILFEQGLTELHRLLRLERDLESLKGRAGDIAARIAGARGRIAELEILILQIDTRRIEESEGGSRDAQARENQVRERLAGVRERLSRMDVRAPLSGEVFGMKVSTLGEVMRPGEPILHIVPKDAKLVVLAQLSPIHVDQVRPGQEAALRFSAFPARVTPKFEGRITRVSADAVQNPQNGATWYEVEVAIGAPIEPDAALPGTAAGWLPDFLRNRLSVAQSETGEAGVKGAHTTSEANPAAAPGDLSLTPGMPVEVHIRITDRSPLSYLSKPLTDFFSRSLREE